MVTLERNINTNNYKDMISLKLDSHIFKGTYNLKFLGILGKNMKQVFIHTFTHIFLITELLNYAQGPPYLCDYDTFVLI